MTARQLVFKISDSLPLDGVPSLAVELHLPESAGYEAPVIHHRLFPGLEMGLVVRGYLSFVLFAKQEKKNRINSKSIRNSYISFNIFMGTTATKVERSSRK